MRLGGHLWLPALIAICCTSESLHGGESSDEPELFPGRKVERYEVTERPATNQDVRLTSRMPVLAEPENWRDVPGPRGERAVFWQETSKRHGYQILDRRGRVLALGSRHLGSRGRPGSQQAFECMDLAWSGDSRRFVALMHREYEHDDVRVTDLRLFGLKPGACRLTATPGVEESSVGWIDDQRVIFQPERWDDDEALSGLGTVLELPALATSPR